MLHFPLPLDEVRRLYFVHDLPQLERMIHFFAYSRCDFPQEAAINNDVTLCYESQAELDIVSKFLRVVAVA